MRVILVQNVRRVRVGDGLGVVGMPIDTTQTHHLPRTSTSHAVINKACSAAILILLIAQYAGMLPSPLEVFVVGELFMGPIRAMCAAFATGGLAVYIWAMLMRLGLLVPTSFKTTEDKTVLIMSGPFDIVRYPHLSAVIVIEFCLGVVSTNLMVLVIALASAVVANYRVAAEDSIYGRLFKRDMISYKSRQIGVLIPIIEIE